MLNECCVKKQRSGQTGLFDMLQVAKMRLAAKLSGVATKRICLQTNNLMVILDGSFNSLNYEKEVHLRRTVDSLVSKLNKAKDFAAGASLPVFSRSWGTSSCFFIILQTLMLRMYVTLAMAVKNF